MEINKQSVELSIFDILECGPGPSSSHTIGPMKAAYEFRKLLEDLNLETHTNIKLKVKLYGSLSATGRGHGTPAAVIAGLLGHKTSECPANLLYKIEHNPSFAYDLKIKNLDLKLAFEDIIFANIIHSYPYANTLIFTLVDTSQVCEAEIFSRIFYSVGGGFILCENQNTNLNRGKTLYTYNNMRQIREILKQTGYTLPELILENELALTGMSRVSIIEKLDHILDLMLDSVRRGLANDGYLPGYLNVKRKAGTLFEKAKTLSSEADRFFAKLNSYAFATAEENASGGVIVTAPTCGSAGLVPSIIYSLIYDRSVGSRVIRESLLAGVCVAFLAKHNASIAGAEVGCQGEVGVASAMGAALLAHSMGNSSQIVENAAEIALEHHLGLSCDPVGGFVQIPCIERNAVGAIKAYNAALLASLEDPSSHQVSLDSVISAMNETGREMNSKFKETSLGGLALSMVNC